MRAVIVDDEPLAVERLKRLLDAVRRVEVTASFTDSVAACAYLNSNCPDVLFLDIEMPEMTGFHLLTQLQVQPLVVFTTAYDQYALRAFEVNSIDYLLKPVEKGRLDRAIAKVERILGGIEPRTSVSALAAELARVLKQREPAYLTRLASRIGDRVEFIDASQVTHFYAKDKLTYAATASKHYVVDHTIADLETKLDAARFIRIHRATILNVDYVKELHAWFGGRLLARLKDGKTELTVARDRAAALKQYVGL